MDQLFNGLFAGELAPTIAITDFLLCLGVSLALGLVLAAVYMWKNDHSRSFLITLALLPAVVCVVIMMVNGNIGAGVAVAGAFSLVRFRSAPGSAKEIVSIFLAMGAGLLTGMGYLAYAALFTVIMCLALLVYNAVAERYICKDARKKTVQITIPEDLNYTDMFEDIFAQFTEEHELIRVKTTNMGSMFRLTYRVSMCAGANEKEMIDLLRQRNGNLEILVSRQENGVVEL